MATYVKEMTQKNVFTAIADLFTANPDLTLTLPGGVVVTAETAAQYMAERAQAVAKKNVNGDKKLTPKQEENQRIMEAVLAHMEWEKKYTVAQLHKSMTENGLFPEGADVSPNRLSALIQKMYKRDGVEDLTMPVHRVVEARVAYFQKNIDYRPAEEVTEEVAEEEVAE